MKIIADFHIHSPYARAVSKEMTLENLDYWARLKGIAVMGTGDFTHPAWMKEIKAKLEPAEKGLYTLKKPYRKDGLAGDTRFVLTVEISSIYSKGGKTRRVHNIVHMPSIESAEKFNATLGRQGNIKSDGRPIVGVGSKELLKIALDSDSDCMFVPAHAWTPWFSVFGSMSGFNAIEECFDELSEYIFAIETGLSSDPAMNWRVSALDTYALLSNSDSHSLRRIGREANIFNTELSYAGIVSAIKSKSPKKFLSTIEFYPEEGMYHFDGHRNCKVRMTPEDTKNTGTRCRVCGKPVTVGVLSRVAELADRPEGFRPENAPPYKNMVPLDEIIAEAFGLGSATGKNVQKEYMAMVKNGGGEIPILFDLSRAELAARFRPEVVEGIMRVREGRLSIEPGFDGQYGTVMIFKAGEPRASSRRAGIF